MIRSLAFIALLFGALATLPAGTARAQAEGGAYLQDPATIQAVPPGRATLTPQEELDRKEFADAYYDRCTAEDDPSLEGTAQEDTCICHMVHMLEYLETEELRTIGTGAGSVPLRKDVLFTKVYAPCLEFAVADMERRRCYNSNRVRRLSTTQQMYESACHCIATGAASFVRRYGEIHMAALLKRNPVLDDPIGGVFRSYEFRDEIGRLYGTCLNKFSQ